MIALRTPLLAASRGGSDVVDFDRSHVAEAVQQSVARQRTRARRGATAAPHAAARRGVLHERTCLSHGLAPMMTVNASRPLFRCGARFDSINKDAAQLHPALAANDREVGVPT